MRSNLKSPFQWLALGGVAATSLLVVRGAWGDLLTVWLVVLSCRLGTYLADRVDRMWRERNP